MNRRYKIDKSFGIYSLFVPPLNRFVLWLAGIFLSVMPKGLNKKDLRVGKVRIPSEDGRGVRAWLIRPAEDFGRAPCLVYFHGGGFVFRAARYHYRNAAEYVRKTGCALLFVDYRLAPRFACPVPDEDCFAAYRWVSENARKLGVDPSRIAVGGDSAGGYLAASVVRRAVDEGLASPCFMMLVYPVLDRRMSTTSMREFTDTPMWNAVLNKKMWAYYSGGKHFLSPAEYVDVSCFPPAYIETAEYDCLRDEALAFADRLRKQGIAVTVRETKGTMHGYDISYKSPVTSESIAARCAALSAAFAGGHLQQDNMQ
ncbi:MAG TPA: alpha/beta hydrolase [Candidatus Coproplasma excrementipullorum]|nr:alpha/beta hydrolase [Candidatus Coproplasma excrementipullorum]